MIKLVETGQGLLLAYPAWIGALILVTGLVFLAYAARPAAAVSRRGLVLLISAAMMLVGMDFISYRILLTDDSAERHGLLRKGQRVEWNGATGAKLEQKKLKGAESWNLVVTEESGTELEVPLSGLPENERERVIAFVTDHIPR